YAAPGGTSQPPAGASRTPSARLECREGAHPTRYAFSIPCGRRIKLPLLDILPLSVGGGSRSRHRGGARRGEIGCVARARQHHGRDRVLKNQLFLIAALEDH